MNLIMHRDLSIHTDADIVCARAKLRFDPNGPALSDTASITTGGGGQASLEQYQQAFKPLHSSQTRRMYYMVCTPRLIINLLTDIIVVMKCGPENDFLKSYKMFTLKFASYL